MPFYVKRGELPDKRHIQFRDSAGKLYTEHHMSREGFSDIYSNLYHIHPPTVITRVNEFKPLTLTPSEDSAHRHRHFKTSASQPEGDWIFSRNPLLFNKDVLISVAVPHKEASVFYRNGVCDELIFVHEGKGVLETQFGNLSFSEGDYLVVPAGITCRLVHQSDYLRLLIVEAYGPVKTPNRYRNNHGQLLEHAPFCERDIRVPEFRQPIDEKGEFPLVVRTRSGWQSYTLGYHPFDVVGWDGFYFPWALNIKDFMPIVGKVHQPPPVHQTFSGPNFVVCSFVPRLFDFHEQAVPIPYHHSNVDSDEVIYYVEGNFMSRRGIEKGSITLHPEGIPHGPQPGLAEPSLEKKETAEYAVMVDTFFPLTCTRDSDEVDDKQYPFSWIPENY
ncbi:MAG: homogentisate 1,2-dioxygenase [Calditrichia bacterium]